MPRRLSLSAALVIICLLGIVGCSGGSRGALPPVTQQAAVASGSGRTTQSLATGSPVVTGTIAGVSSTQILIQGGLGCGYVNVNYTSSTPIAYNGYALSNGVTMYVWGSGNCGTSFTATYISLGTSTVATPTPSPSSAPVVSGAIASVSSTQILIQGGPGCGYVNVNYTSSTPIAYNGYKLANGVMTYVWGTGSCATSFIASSLSLGQVSTTPAPSPSPSPAAAPIVSGTIAGVSSTQILIQGGAGCGYVNVNYTRSTPIAYNGYTLSSGVVLNVWGAGNCATAFTASALSLGQIASATPTPTPTAKATPTLTPTPKPTATATPTPTPTTSIGDTTFTSIVDPGQWPANFRPYCANASANPSSPCPWNGRLPDNPAQLYPNSSSLVASLFSGGYMFLPGDWSVGGDYNHPAYLASASDHLVTVTCTAYCGVGSATFAIPLQARAAGGGDGHMAVIEPDGTEWDLYQAGGYTGQTAFSASGLYKTSILGSGAVPGGGVTSGAALIAGAIRSDELARGVVPHALFASTNCVSGSYVYPGSAQAQLCSSGTGPPVGARLQLTLTDAQINALGLPAWEAAILHAMHDYGVYILDTSGGSSPGSLYLRFESQTQYAAYNAAYPYASMGLNIGGFDTALSWGQSFRIVSSCYAQETCTQ